MFKFVNKNRKIKVDEELAEEIKVSNKKVELKKSYVQSMLKNHKLPIVLLDPLWHTARQQIQSSVIDVKEKELQELLKEQGRLNNDFKEYNKVKQNFFKQILQLSGEIQSEENAEKIEELNKVHKSTLAANEKLEEINKRLSTIEEEIDMVNREIIEEMVAVGYEYIDTCKNNIINLDNEITALRQQLLKRTAEKKNSQKLLKDIYNYLHSILGQEQMEWIDRSFGEEK